MLCLGMQWYRYFKEAKDTTQDSPRRTNKIPVREKAEPTAGQNRTKEDEIASGKKMTAKERRRRRP